MSKTNIDKTLNRILIVFLMLQPVLDIYMGVVKERLDIFGISLATIIRIAVISVMFIAVLFKQIKYKYHLKSVYCILGYLALVITYVLLHHFNIINSNGYYASKGLYSFMTEISYVLRLVLPVLLIYVTIIIKPSKKEICRAVMVAVLIIALTIILTNVFKISFASYSPDNNTITYNMFDWFKNEEVPYKESLSKGFFVSANQIGAVLVILLPIVLFYTLKENKSYCYFILLMQIISMILVGTRVASYGFFAVFLAVICLYIILVIMKINKRPTLQAIVLLVIIIEVGTLLFINSPARNRKFVDSYESIYDNEEVKKDENYIDLEIFKSMLNDNESLIKYVNDTSVSEKKLKYTAMCKYIENTYKYHHISTKYISKIYPYTDDPEFWIDIFSKSLDVKGANRGRQVAIIQRIKKNNNNELLDSFFGLGATPLNQREYMIENDIISHYYNLGIIGIILFITPFLYGIAVTLWDTRKNVFKIFNIQLDVFILGIFMAFCTGYFAGHVLDEYIASIYLAVISGVVFNYFRQNKEVKSIEDKT